jgi:chromosome segregation ATPase
LVSKVFGKFVLV